MAVVVVLTLLLAMAGGISGAQWCVCRTGLSDSALQKTIDYACGAGADCTPIIQNGACYQPNTVIGHCSYAANSYFQKKGQVSGSCDFAGTATITTTDPSPGGTCSYPSSASSSGTTPSTSTSPTTTTPSTFNSSPTGIIGGGIGGISTGLGPSGVISTDPNGGFLAKMDMGFLSLALFLSSAIIFLRA